MPINDNSAKSVVMSAVTGTVNQAAYSDKASAVVDSAVEKLNNSIFGKNSRTKFDVSMGDTSLASLQDFHNSIVENSSTRTGFVNDITGMNETEVYEASLNYQSNNVTYRAFVNVDGSVGAGVKFNNGDMLSGAYTKGSGAEVAYTLTNPITKLKVGAYYNEQENVFGAAGLFHKQLTHKADLGVGVTVDTTGDWSVLASSNIVSKQSNIRLSAGIQRDFGETSGFIGASITF